jgi:hypothetical protein
MRRFRNRRLSLHEPPFIKAQAPQTNLQIFSDVAAPWGTSPCRAIAVEHENGDEAELIGKAGAARQARPARYLRTIASSSTTPNPGPGDSSIIPFFGAGRFAHSACQTGSRSGSAEHST